MKHEYFKDFAAITAEMIYHRAILNVLAYKNRPGDNFNVLYFFLIILTFVYVFLYLNVFHNVPD